MPVIDGRVREVESRPLGEWPRLISVMSFDDASTQYLRERYRLIRARNARKLARRDDPSSSHQAARRMVTSGARDSHMLCVVAAIRRAPGHTSAELAKLTGMERHEVARRTADAEHDGLAYKGGQRTCDVSGRAAVTWWPSRVLTHSQVNCLAGDFK